MGLQIATVGGLQRATRVGYKVRQVLQYGMVQL